MARQDKAVLWKDTASWRKMAMSKLGGEAPDAVNKLRAERDHAPARWHRLFAFIRLIFKA